MRNGISLELWLYLWERLPRCCLLIAAGLLGGTVADVRAETPWHLQPMDTWHDGECYRSPYAGGGDTSSNAVPAVTFKVGQLVMSDDLPGKVLRITGSQEWHTFRSGQSAYGYHTKDVQGGGYWVPTARLTARSTIDSSGLTVFATGATAEDREAVRQFREERRADEQRQAQADVVDKPDAEIAKWKAAYDREQARKAKQAAKRKGLPQDRK